MNTAVSTAVKSHKFLTDMPKAGDRLVTDAHEYFGIVQEVSEPIGANATQKFVRVRYIECDSNFVPLEPFLGFKWTTKTVNDADIWS